MKKLPKKKNPFATLQSDEPAPIPYQSLVGIAVTQPILPDSVQKRVDASIVPYMKRVRWEAWGMNTIKKAGTAVLLTGPSGTGKTTIAKYLAKKVGNGIIAVTLADLGGGHPGDTERNIKRVFQRGVDEDNCPIFMDECDAVLWAREKAGPDSMWMLGVVNEALIGIENYPGLVILATNMAHLLDPALERRLSDTIYVPVPNADVRSQLWWHKIPEAFPYQPNEGQLVKLSSYNLTGAEIENCIITEAKTALHENRNPKFESLCNIASQAQGQSRRETKSTKSKS